MYALMALTGAVGKLAQQWTIHRLPHAAADMWREPTTEGWGITTQSATLPADAHTHTRNTIGFTHGHTGSCCCKQPATSRTPLPACLLHLQALCTQLQPATPVTECMGHHEA